MKKSSGFALVELIAALVVLILVALVGFRIFKSIQQKIADKSHAPVSQTDATTTYKGVSLSPKSYAASDFSAFFGQAAKSANVVSWAGNWSQLEKAGSAPYTVAKLGERYGYQPVIIVGANDEKSGKLQAVEKQRFVAAVQNFAGATKVPYIGLGNEMNRVRAKSVSGYDAFTEWFAEAAAAIKQTSPQTKVFTTFQYELLNGLGGGLFGGTNDESAADWQLLDDFPAADLLAFTTYPYLVYKNPDLIPGDYYSRLNPHTTKPVAFSEVGWPSGTEAAGYDSTPEEQAAFMGRFADLTSDLAKQFVIWPFLYDQDVQKPFTTVGLIDRSGNPKPALAIWQGLDVSSK